MNSQKSSRTKTAKHNMPGEHPQIIILSDPVQTISKHSRFPPNTYNQKKSAFAKDNFVGHILNGSSRRASPNDRFQPIGCYNVQAIPYNAELSLIP